MLEFILSILAAVGVFFRTRADTAVEVLALRQQVAVLKRKRPRPPLTRFDRFFWTTWRQLWPRWSDVLAVVKPETVVGWHRARFRFYWRFVPTLTFRLLYCFFVIEHGRRRILHFNVTAHPTSEWVVQ